MARLIPLLILTIDGQLYALHLTAVDRVVHAVEVTPLPMATPSVLGVVNFHGQILPVLNLRHRFRISARAVDANDHFVVAHTSKRMVVLVVDQVLDIVEIPSHEIISAKHILPASELVEGIVKLNDDLILIHDLETFLSSAEESILDSALAII